MIRKGKNWFSSFCMYIKEVREYLCDSNPSEKLVSKEPERLNQLISHSR